MNKKQRIVIIIGIILVLICGLFPPYEGKKDGTIRANLIRKEGAIGYYFLFSPPSAKDISEKLSKQVISEKAFIPVVDEHLSKEYEQLFVASIMMSKYLIQIITIVLVTTGLVLYFTESEKI